MTTKSPRPKKTVTLRDIADIRDALDLASDHKPTSKVTVDKAGHALDRIVTALFAKKP